MKGATEDVYYFLNKVIESDVFKKSNQYVALLKFLVESYINKTPVKETILETELSEIFGRQNAYDGKVRVYMYNLRKKLSEYYRTEGVEDAQVLRIEKGQYNLSIDKKTSASQVRTVQYLKTVLWVMLPILAIAAFYLYRQSEEQPTYVWKEFFKGNNSSVCYVGDHHTVWGNIDDTLHASVHFELIDSDAEFDDMINSEVLNDSKFAKINYTFVTKMGPIAASRLTYWFALHDYAQLEIRMQSNFNATSLTKENIIFIGPHKTLDGLKTLFLRNSELFGFNGYNITNQRDTIVYEDRSEDEEWYEYVMVSYNPVSDKDHKALFFTSNHDIGVMAAVSNFTDQEWLAEFYQQLPNEDAYFNALFLVRGIARTNIDCTLVELEVLEDK